MQRIKYECAKCGWQASVPVEWADVKPGYCGNYKCSHSKAKAPKSKKSFKLDPSALIVHRPAETEYSQKDVKVVKRRKYKEKSEFKQEEKVSE